MSGAEGRIFQLTGTGVTTTYIQHIQLVIELTRQLVNSTKRQTWDIYGSPDDLFVFSRSVVGHFGGKVVLIPIVRDFYID